MGAAGVVSPEGWDGAPVDAARRGRGDFDSIRAEARLKQLFGVATLDGFGRFGRADLAAAGGLIAYLEAVGRGSIPHLAPPQKIEPQDVMAIDPATRESLAIARSSAGARGGRLLDCIDRKSPRLNSSH